MESKPSDLGFPTGFFITQDVMESKPSDLGFPTGFFITQDVMESKPSDLGFPTGFFITIVIVCKASRLPHALTLAPNNRAMLFAIVLVVG